MAKPVRPVLAKAELPILVTLSGTTTLVNAAQPENAESPKLVTPSGTVTLVKPVPAKAEYPDFGNACGNINAGQVGAARKHRVIDNVRLLGMTTFVRPVSANAPLPRLVTLSGITMLVRRVPEKAELPMLATLSGIATPVTLVSENAPAPMLATLLPIVTLVKPEQYRNALSPIVVTPLPMVTLVKL